MLALVAHLVSLAILFRARSSLPPCTVVVYAGAATVLYVFVVAYVGGAGETIGERTRSGARSDRGCASAVRSSAGARRSSFLIALLGSGPSGGRWQGRGLQPGLQTFGMLAYIEVAVLRLPARFRGGLLFPAADRCRRRSCVARRRGGAGRGGRGGLLEPLRLLRPGETGTMVEGVGVTRRS